jgi:hypothetical protein
MLDGKMVAKEPNFIVSGYFVMKVNRLIKTLQMSTSKAVVTFDPTNTLLYHTRQFGHVPETSPRNLVPCI